MFLIYSGYITTKQSSLFYYQAVPVFEKLTHAYDLC